MKNLEMSLTVLILISIIKPATMTAIDNSVVEARLSCKESEMDLSVSLKRPLFQPGRIYVKGRSDDSRCGVIFDPSAPRIDYVMGNIGYRVPLAACGMERSIARNPSNRKLTYTMTLVVSFHPIFITKVDRAYKLVCNYGGTPKTAVTAAFSVSMIPTQEVPSLSFAMPNCIYSIYAGDSSIPVRYAKVGDRIRHSWICKDLTPNQKIWVHDCSVSPEYGEGNRIIDSRGCTIDAVVMGELNYVSSSMVIATHHAYKYADHPTLLFKCTISICDTNRPRSCATFPPPNCSRLSRPLRSLNNNIDNTNLSTTAVDVLSHTVHLVDVTEESTVDYALDATMKQSTEQLQAILDNSDAIATSASSVCVSGAIFAAIILSVFICSITR